MTTGPAARGGAAAVAAFLLCAGATFWLTGGVKPFEHSPMNPWHHYEYLAEGFVQGHTFLSLEPDAALLRLPDPYDPTANLPYRLWDASLYAGKYYLYYGPTPALVLMVPWRLLTGHGMAQRTAVAVFAVLALAFLGRLIWEVRRRFFPEVGAWALAAVILVTFHASWLPVTLRRPGVWELPIVAAEACLWAALYFFWRFRESGGRPLWGAATGAALALLMGSRVTSLFGAGAVVLLLLVPFGPGGLRAVRWRGPLLAAALAALGGVALLFYNHARFGRWAEFGQSYQLWGMDERHVRHFDPAYIAANAHLYLSALPALSPFFPFLRATWPTDLPSGYIATEEMQGILFVMPVHLAGLLALAWISRRKGDSATAPLRLLLIAGAVVSFLAAAVLFCFAGACSRYVTELLEGWTVVTAVGLLVATARLTGSPRRRAARGLVWAAAAWSVAAVWLASAGFRGFMAMTEPRTYAAAAHLLDYPSWWWAQAHGARFGPLDLDLKVPGPVAEESALVASGAPSMRNQLLLAPAGPGRVKLLVVANLRVILETDPIAVPNGTLHLRLSAPWLYPPAAHPYWDTVPPAERADRREHFILALPTATFEAHSSRAFDSAAFAPLVSLRETVPPGAPFVAAATTVAP